MPERELTPERDKRKKDFKAENAPETNEPPAEDAPEGVVTPELEGETTKKIDKTKRR